MKGVKEKSNKKHKKLKKNEISHELWKTKRDKNTKQGKDKQRNTLIYKRKNNSIHKVEHMTIRKKNKNVCQWRTRQIEYIRLSVVFVPKVDASLRRVMYVH
jgi:hypothetical protein